MSNSRKKHDRLQALTARWVLPIASEPVENGVVVLSERTIEAVCERADFERRFKGVSLVDYGDAVIMPGLINLHTHLDYTALRAFDTQSDFFSWIRGLAGRAFKWTTDEWRASALAGAKEIALSGTTCVADSSYSGAAAWAVAKAGLRGVVALEVFGVNSGRAQSQWSDWLSRYDGLAETADEPLAGALEQGRVILTVSPHAPYTVCPELWRLAADWAISRRLPILCHISESKSECQWFSAGSPEIDDFLVAMVPGGVDGGPQSLTWKGAGHTPVGHLEKHSLLNDRTLAAHAVQLTAADMKTFRKRGVKVAHCPRSNSRLRCGTAPFPAMVASGLTVGFGTDSAASGDDLDVVAEARFAAGLRRALTPDFSMTAQEIVKKLTLEAAAALNLEDRIGSLEAGKEADLAVFDIEGPAAYALDRPYDLLLYGGAKLRDLAVGGAWVVRDRVVSNLETGGHFARFPGS